MWWANTALIPFTAANCGPYPLEPSTNSSRPLVDDRRRDQPRVRVPRGEAVAEEREQLGDLAGELGRRVDVDPAAQHVRGQRVGAGRAAEREVDPARVHAPAACGRSPRP